MLEPRNNFRYGAIFYLPGFGDYRVFLLGNILCFPHLDLLAFFLLGGLHLSQKYWIVCITPGLVAD